VDRLDGTIYANDTLDREKQSSYEIIVKASNDNEYPNKNVTISLYRILGYNLNYFYYVFTLLKFVFTYIIYLAGWRRR